MSRKLWQFTTELALADRIMALFEPDRSDSAIRIPNEDVQFEFAQDVVQPLIERVGPGGMVRIATAPPPLQLVITEPEIAPHYFNIGFEFVSADMRAAMALADDDVQWFPVDATGSTSEVVARDYRVLHVVHYADPFDRGTSDGGGQPYYRRDGTVEQRWDLRLPDPRLGPIKVGFRSDFVAPAPLFRTVPAGWTLVTDDVAERVGAAGIDDVRFYSPENDGTVQDLDYR